MAGESGPRRVPARSRSCRTCRNRVAPVRFGREFDLVFVWLACHGLEEAFEFLVQKAVDTPGKFAVMNEKAIEGRAGRELLCRAGDRGGDKAKNEKLDADDRR